MGADPDSLAREFYDEPMMVTMADDGLGIVLSEQEMQSALWLKISAWMESRLSELREMNDYTSTPLETEKLRGKIELLKELRSAGLNRVLNEEGVSHPLPGDDLGY